jgi:hypothetical protein
MPRKSNRRPSHSKGPNAGPAAAPLEQLEAPLSIGDAQPIIAAGQRLRDAVAELTKPQARYVRVVSKIAGQSVGQRDRGCVVGHLGRRSRRSSGPSTRHGGFGKGF